MSPNARFEEKDLNMQRTHFSRELSGSRSLQSPRGDRVARSHDLLARQGNMRVSGL